MKRTLFALAAASLAAPALAQDTRALDAHVHGVTTAEIAVEHGRVEINLLSPGMDIVGFEYEASTAADKEAVAAAIRQFLAPESIVTLPEAAGCRLTEVLAHLHSGDHEGEHGEEDHGDHADHDDGHGHDDHDDHGEGAEHSAFHVTYGFACEDEGTLTTIGFPFFDRFANAQEIEVQYVTETGAGMAEVIRSTPELSLE